MRWLAAQASDDLLVSTLTYGELKRGVAGLAPGARQAALTAWLTEWLADFGGRILPVDLPVADAWGRCPRG